MPRRPTSSARDEDGDKHRGHTFAAVEAIGRALPGVEVTTAWGQPALKVHGKMFVCIASYKSAEPNSLVMMMAFADRDALVEDRFVNVQMLRKSDAGSRRGTARPSRARR
jgi:hypothetical protein